MRIDGVDIEAVFGCVPANAVDNMAALAPLVGEEKAAAIVQATGFATRRIASEGTDVIDLALPAAQRALEGVAPGEVGGVIAVSFSSRDRFPALAARLQNAFGLPHGIAACDLSMACSGWIYGLFAAAQMVKASGRKVLLVDGDVQSAWIDRSDANTLAVMGDGATATLLSPGGAAWEFGFYTDGAGADTLRCRDAISMDGFGVFRFVAGPVRRFLEDFMRSSQVLAGASPVFVPHQANMYMVRQLADALGLKEGVVGSGEKYANTGSCSAALTLATINCQRPTGNSQLATQNSQLGTVLLAGFGAGLSAGAAATTLGAYRRGVEEI